MTGRSVSQQPGDLSGGNSGPVVPASSRSHDTAATSGNHDPLCPLADDCRRAAGHVENQARATYCVWCGQDCECDLIARIRAAVRSDGR